MTSTATFRVNHPGFLDAFADEHQMVVFGSPVVRDDDPILQPVLDRIQHFELELADEITVKDDSMMFGESVLRWYMTRPALRDGLLGFDGPDALRRMWENGK
ncbi:hypothetical protein [Mycobacterium scrofulaceum]|uniref:Uncharacterized protein n=1 Tax=Mycobacterium scrofulaceum TaxID=1783 RepID=A0A1X0KD57_MYCSC|nr:hypothetical protein [Mycobacterium scrofulaceum]ORB73134.1 hypothetical protein BST44_16340 [Mycobacterium scrofulaceum]